MSGSRANPIAVDALYTDDVIDEVIDEVIDLTGDDVIRYPGKTIGDGLEVRPSDLPESGDGPVGNGLFATVDFSKGDVITIYDGEVISSKEAKAVDANGRPLRAQTHMKNIDHHSVIDGLKHPVPGRGGGSFMNDPRDQRRRFPYNAKMVCVACVGARGRNAGIGRGVHVVATRPIRAGDEIYAPYGRKAFVYAMPY